MRGSAMGTRRNSARRNEGQPIQLFALPNPSGMQSDHIDRFKTNHDWLELSRIRMTHPRRWPLRGDLLGKHSSRGPKPFDARPEFTIRSMMDAELRLKKPLRLSSIVPANEPIAHSGVVYALEGQFKLTPGNLVEQEERLLFFLPKELPRRGTSC